MRLVRNDPGAVDPTAFQGREGIALEAVADAGDRVGTIAARVEGRIATIFERWVAGESDVLEPLANQLMSMLVAEFGVSEIRAGADSDRLYAFYTVRLGMKPWHEIVTYERPMMQPTLAPRSPASIRPVDPRDVPAISLLVGKPGGAADLLRIAERSPSRFVVAELDGQFAGYALSYGDGAECLLKSLMVAAQFRQRGVGWDLTCDAIALADRLRLPSRLHTPGDNAPARRLYESLGYQQVAITRLVRSVFANLIR